MKVIRCEYKPQGGRSPSGAEQQRTRNLPMAPPPRMPPPPPPPPPAMEVDVPENSIKGVSRRAIFGIMLGGSLLWYGALRVGSPVVGLDKKRGLALLRTKGGNVVVAAQDEEGRIFIFDKAGNIYYDTGDAATGLYIVDRAGDTYNEYENAKGEVQRVYVGNLKEIESIEVTEIGGMKVEELRKSVKGFKGGRVVGFPKLPSKDGVTWENLMPPNAPVVRSKSGEVVGVPPMLEDLEIDFEAKGGGLPREPADVISLFRSLRRE